MNSPPLTIIILNWNGRDLLGDCLTSVLELNYPNYEVVLVDNGSTDDSVAYVNAHFPTVKVIETGKNLGFAVGNNVALRHWQGEIAVLLNPDVMVSPDWLANLVQPLVDDERAGISGSKLHYPGGRTLQHAGGRLLFPQALPTHAGVREVDRGQYDQERDVEYVIGAAMAFKRVLVEEIGLLDEGFFLYFEDVDYCYRARRAGYRVIYAPAAVAVHVESAVAGKGSATYLQRFHSSRWRFLLKHFTFEDLIHSTYPAEESWLRRISSMERTAVIEAYRNARRLLSEATTLGRQHPFSPEQTQKLRDEMARLEQIAGYTSAVSAAENHADDPLWRAAAVREEPFVSSLPLLGGMVAGFRELWNNVSTKWYVRRLLNQQNEFNQLAVSRLRELEARLAFQEQRLTDLKKERDELKADLSRLSRRLQELDDFE